MKNTKSLGLALGMMAALAVAAASFTYETSKPSSFRLKTAQAAYAVECDCALLGGNDKCLANNYGSQCASAGTENCQSHNSNCGGKNEEVN
jgi:hypothetical protein